MNIILNIANRLSVPARSDAVPRLWQIAIILTSMFLLAACGFGSEDLATLVPDIELQGADEGDEALNGTPSLDESPRTSSGIEIPPTWTPGALDRSISVNPEPVSTQETIWETEVETAPESSTYEVQPGDTLAEIAIQFNVSLAEIAAANNIEDLDHIEVGQILTIPQ